MIINIENWLSSLNTFEKQEIRWRISNDDLDFFNECIGQLKKYNIKNILDISCGLGRFVDMCNENNIMAYGIDPVENSNKNIYLGTYSSTIKNSQYLEDFKFDCISVHGTLHGKHHNVDELNSLFNFFKKHANFIIITNPAIDGNFLNNLIPIYHFNGSHGNKSAMHIMYKVDV